MLAWVVLEWPLSSVISDSSAVNVGVTGHLDHSWFFGECGACV